MAAPCKRGEVGFVDPIDVGAGFEQHLDRFFGAVDRARRARLAGCEGRTAEAGGHHERRRAVDGGDLLIGARRQQRPDDVDAGLGAHRIDVAAAIAAESADAAVGRVGGHPQRRRAAQIARAARERLERALLRDSRCSS